MLFLTAYDEAASPLADIHDASIDLYVERLKSDGITPPERQRRRIPSGYSKPASWFKVRAILDALPHHDYVWWQDVDSIIVGTDAPYGIINATHTLYISSDLNGINCGSMVWRNCDESRDALWRIYESYERFCGHPWWEQAALMEFVSTLNVYQVAKAFLNSGPAPDDVTPESFIYHVPGKGPDEKLTLLKSKLAKVKKMYGH